MREVRRLNVNLFNLGYSSANMREVRRLNVNLFNLGYIVVQI